MITVLASGGPGLEDDCPERPAPGAWRRNMNGLRRLPPLAGLARVLGLAAMFAFPAFAVASDVDIRVEHDLEGDVEAPAGHGEAVLDGLVSGDHMDDVDRDVDIKVEKDEDEFSKEIDVKLDNDEEDVQKEFEVKIERDLDEDEDDD
jgi:hypothetical protein